LNRCCSGRFLKKAEKPVIMRVCGGMAPSANGPQNRKTTETDKLHIAFRGRM
jgi:hypothetical protein